MGNYWTAFDWGKYERKTAHLSVTEHGAYFLLLKHYYQTGTPLPANAEILLRVCRAFADHEKAAVTTVLAEFFTLEGDKYHNQTADEELAKASELSEKRRVAGKLGAEKTNGKTPANGAANKRQLPTQLQSQLHNKTLSPTPSPDSDEEIFKIAKAYPRLNHLRSETEIPRAIVDEIIRAIGADGFLTVFEGTETYAKSLDDPKFARKTWDFFHEFEYRQEHQPKKFGNARQSAAKKAMDEAFS